jgi:capsular exopolysaccharide synthesis family protein
VGTPAESDTVELRDYVRMLRRRWRLVVFLTLIGIAAATAATAAQPREYTARADLFVSAQDRATAGDLSSAYSGGLFTQARVKSYVSIVQSLKVAQLVKDDLNLDIDADQLQKKIAASAPLDQVIIHVTAQDGDPAIAQQIANSVGKVLPGLVDSLEQPANGGPSPVRVSVVQEADLPTQPTSPRPTLNLVLGLLVGLALGVGAAVLRETLDTSVNRREQVEEILNAPVLGAVSFDSDAPKNPLGVITAPQSVRAEAIRQLRTNLQFVDIEHPLRSVVITSSVPGEGKSTTAANLAITLVQAGLRVIVVEADLRRPKMAEFMGIEGAVGLTSVLLGQVALTDALQQWGNQGLLVLPSGPLPPNPSELLGSSRMQDLLTELEGLADMVIIDAPPLLPVTDAAVLGTLTSGLVMVIRAHHTKREQIARAASTVHVVGAVLLGGVLNMVPTKGPDAYGYGYEYRYTKDRGKLRHDESLVSENARAMARDR